MRAYGGNKDSVRFERAVNIRASLCAICRSLQDGTDFIYSWSAVSAIMAEQSWGYTELGRPENPSNAGGNNGSVTAGSGYQSYRVDTPCLGKSI